MSEKTGGTMGEKRCSQRVYTNSRADFHGHMCTKPYAVTVANKDYCSFHDPIARNARIAERNAKDDAEFEAQRKQRQLREAAPDLLAACKAILKVYENGDGDSEEGHALIQIQSAITKAEGR